MFNISLLIASFMLKISQLIQDQYGEKRLNILLAINAINRLFVFHQAPLLQVIFMISMTTFTLAKPDPTYVADSSKRYSFYAAINVQIETWPVRFHFKYLDPRKEKNLFLVSRNIIIM